MVTSNQAKAALQTAKNIQTDVNDVLAQARAKAAQSKAGSPVSTTNARETSENKEGYINRVEFSGRLGREPEYKVLESGKELVSSSLATLNPGNYNEDTMWFELVMWLNEEATDKGPANRELFETFLAMTKGAAVVARGRQSMRTYTDKSGVLRTSVTITLSDIT